ncbi:MAG: hypothetical protein MUC38_00295 [Cyclobacteriaceae bacterium]|jgi:hypothetical protein|nr:hypothetical protein [Cyclobacteriaceae bacterium]
MKKRTIVIASVLKPVDDTRMFEKMAQSLAATGRYEVVVIGRSSPSAHVPNIRQHGIGSFARLSAARWTASFRIAAHVWRSRPAVWVVATHELLAAAFWLRILRQIPFVYDIRENYYRNIRYADAFPWPLRGLIAGWVRIKERMIAPWAHHLFVAERGYVKEMPFARTATVIENKSLLNDVRNGKPQGKKLLFSGTLAESTGILEVIAWSKALHARDASVTLHIIGHAAQGRTQRRIAEAIRGHEFITLEGGDTLVPHTRIAAAIRAADFGWIAYRPSPMVENTMPTKLYEYLACHLPILLVDHAPWTDTCAAHGAAIVIKLPFDAARVLAQMNTHVFYPTPASDATWAGEARMLVAVLDGLLLPTR